jgi:mono/diheme cytochrome c family protein
VSSKCEADKWAGRRFWPIAAASAAGACLWFALLLVAPESLAQRPDFASSELSAGYKFTEQSGESLFKNVCRGCHMAEGEGATGAGAYPALANDEALSASGYAVYVVLYGRRAMPSFAEMMSDEQVAAVVNYLRSHFGNHYNDPVSAKDVAVVRPR